MMYRAATLIVCVAMRRLAPPCSLGWGLVGLAGAGSQSWMRRKLGAERSFTEPGRGRGWPGWMVLAVPAAQTAETVDAHCWIACVG